MTGSIFLAVLGVAGGFSAGFAIGTVWTMVACHRGAARMRGKIWIGYDPGAGDRSAVLGDPDEIERLLKAAREKPLNLNITTTETDNDHRPR